MSEPADAYAEFALEHGFGLLVREASIGEHGPYLKLALTDRDGRESLVPLHIAVLSPPFYTMSEILCAYQTVAILAEADHDFGTAGDPEVMQNMAKGTLTALRNFLGEDLAAIFLKEIGYAEITRGKLDSVPRLKS